ncbi:hypothetical protein BGZ79_004463 [Entomortierella chlamydospora]|nr:hypothetical protein BGZ79_004463 [Entomortierella chlamydospora]
MLVRCRFSSNTYAPLKSIPNEKQSNVEPNQVELNQSAEEFRALTAQMWTALDLSLKAIQGCLLEMTWKVTINFLAMTLLMGSRRLYVALKDTMRKSHW